MKPLHMLVLPLLVGMTLACNLTAAPTPTLPAELPFPTEAAVATQIEQGTDVPIPTETIAPAPTNTSISPAIVNFDEAANAYRIQFPPMGTWVNVTDNLQAGSSKQFVLGAMQSQTMSISIRQTLGFRIKITGKDGAELTVPDFGRGFWRGVLPSTQDYYVTVSGDMSGTFEMRVAINPPELPTQSFEINLPEANLSLRHTDEFAPIDFPYIDPQRPAPNVTLAYIDFSSYEKTNLGEAYLVITALRGANQVADCAKNNPGEQSLGPETINNITYTKSTLKDAAAGNLYDQTRYRTVQNNTCYEILLFLHSANIGNFPEGTVKEFDAPLITEKFVQVINSIKFVP